MPTDQVLTLIAEMRAKADAMPAGPYLSHSDVIDGDVFRAPAILHTVPVTQGGEYTYPLWLMEEHHTDYFASLDPALVRALLRLAEAMMRYPQGTSWADYDELIAAENEFRALAADRVAS